MYEQGRLPRRARAASEANVTAFPHPPREQRPPQRLGRTPRARPPASPGRHNLPAALTSFIGREREIAALQALLATTRLLTLTGAPGVGKTRLALEVAGNALAAYPDGVWLVELAALTEPALVPQAVGAALDVRERPGRPLASTLVEALRARRLLLILDNCEHLVEACAALAEALLQGCAGLTILATSREGLRIGGETAWPVPSLTLPAAETVAAVASPLVPALTAYEAIRLFVERAGSAAPAFRLTERNARAVARVCNHLDGIPLALELAAARVRVLPVETLAERLDDQYRFLTGGSRTALPRQQTLRALVDWSYALLSDPERALLRRLSVFAGGWSLEAAEAVCAGNGTEAGQVLALLGQLVEKSLVLVDESSADARYRFLEMIREYAAERLREAGEEPTLRQRHCDWVVRLVERAEPALFARDAAAWVGLLRRELDNVRAAWDWSKADPGGAEACGRLAAALWYFWPAHCSVSEGRARLAESLDASRERSPARVKVLLAVGWAAYMQRDHAASRSSLTEALALARALDYTYGIAASLIMSGLVATMEGDLDGAETMLANATALALEAGETYVAAGALQARGLVACARAAFPRAAELMESGLNLVRTHGEPWLTYQLLVNLGYVAFVRGDRERAGQLFREGLVLCHSIRDAIGIGQSLEGLAWVASAHEDAQRAARLLGVAEALGQATGVTLNPLWHAQHESAVTTTRRALGEERFGAAWADGRALSLDQAAEYALVRAAPAGAVPATGDALAANSPAGRLSRREHEVAALIAQGLTNRQIAATLVIAERTADTHVSHILNKLGFATRAQVAAWAAAQRLVWDDRS